MVRRLETEGRAASQGEMAVLARWSGWGSAPELFDPGSRRYRSQAAQLRSLLSEREWDAARRTTINAHYTSAEIVVAMWDLVTGLGFEPAGARVLEPGCGSGNFIGFAPAGVTVTGVELDPVTAKIAQALYPQATIRAESFADSPLADGRFDLVIGNVPFSSAVLLDRAHNRAGRSMHNHFVVKSLDLTRPGGLVAVVTSRFTLDAQADEARLAMSERADLIGAIRLPARTFKASADTEVVTDVLVLRRRPPGQPPRSVAWRSVVAVDTPDGPVMVNEYFAARPDMIAGRLGVGGGQYNAADPTVTADAARPVADRFRWVVEAGHERGLTYTAPPGGIRARPGPAAPALAAADVPAVRKEGSIVATGPGGFGRIIAGDIEPHKPPKSQQAELAALIELRDTMVALLDLQSCTLDDGQLAGLQARLNHLYDRYATRFGPISRHKQARTGRADPDTGEDLYRPLTRPWAASAATRTSRPCWPWRTTTPRPAWRPRRRCSPGGWSATTGPPLGADTPAEALAISLDQTGRVDLERIASLLGVEAGQARKALGTMVWSDPDVGHLVTASSTCRATSARNWPEPARRPTADPAYQVNVAALQAVQPVDLTAEEIDARRAPPGSPSRRGAVSSEVFGGQGGGGAHRGGGQLESAGAHLAAEHCRRPRRGGPAGPTPSPCSRSRSTSNATRSTTAPTTSESSTRNRPAGGRETAGPRHRFAAWVWEDPARAHGWPPATTAVQLDRAAHLATVRTRPSPACPPSSSPAPTSVDAVWRAVQEPKCYWATRSAPARPPFSEYEGPVDTP